VADLVVTRVILPPGSCMIATPRTSRGHIPLPAARARSWKVVARIERVAGTLKANACPGDIVSTGDRTSRRISSAILAWPANATVEHVVIRKPSYVTIPQYNALTLRRSKE